MKTFSKFSFIVILLLQKEVVVPRDAAGEKNLSSKNSFSLPVVNKIPGLSGLCLLSFPLSNNAPGLKDTTVSPSISLYPNPVTGKKVYLNSSALAAGEYLVQVFNLSGKKLVQQKISRTEKDDQHIIFLPERIKPGFYSLRIEGDGYNDRTTFVVK